MRKYEIMYILMPQLSEEDRKNEIEKLNKILTDNGAKVTDVNEWGIRELAYEIKDQMKGYYVVEKVEAEPAATKEFDRLVKIDANVIRHIIVVDKN
ncbi:MAG: 30S ribosomal protein S6 [Erysipelotrichaceae bacterium]|nr:30S ribosomal protein S6 [Erysipelotrichaceae bacterium]